MSDSRVANTEVPLAAQNRLQGMPENMGQELQLDQQEPGTSPGETAEDLVPITSKFIEVRSKPGESGAKPLEWLDPGLKDILRSRAEEIDSNYTFDPKVEIVDPNVVETGLPIQVAETARQWLRSNNLILASHDPAFWRALEYVLGSLESFSIDAVIEALVICTTDAYNNPLRRVTLYGELRAARAIKKVRDLELKIRTAQVVAQRSLISAKLIERIEENNREEVEIETWDAQVTAAKAEEATADAEYKALLAETRSLMHQECRGNDLSHPSWILGALVEAYPTLPTAIAIQRLKQLNSAIQDGAFKGAGLATPADIASYKSGRGDFSMRRIENKIGNRDVIVESAAKDPTVVA